jgi:AcrR family transcriptional regulator
LRPALLRAAGEILEKQGLDGIKLRSLARRAGVSHNAPYRHFADAGELLAALATEGFELFKARMANKAASEFGAAYVAFALEHPQRFRLMFGGSMSINAHPALGQASSGAYETLLAVFRARTDVADPGIAAAAAWSLVHGLATLLLDGHFEQATRRGAEIESFVRRVLGSVRFAGTVQRSA